ARATTESSPRPVPTESKARSSPVRQVSPFASAAARTPPPCSPARRALPAPHVRSSRRRPGYSQAVPAAFRFRAAAHQESCAWSWPKLAARGALAVRHAPPELSARSALADEPRPAPTKSFRFPNRPSVLEPSAMATRSSELRSKLALSEL